MAPEFFPILALIGSAIISLFGMIVGAVLLLTAHRNRKRQVVSTVVLGGSFLLALLVYLCIPGTPRTALELCGTYVLDCDLIHEQLVLNDDGTFSQTVSVRATGEVMSSNGSWKYEKSGWLSGEVTFDGFLVVLEWPDRLRADYAQKKPWVAVMPATYSFGQLELGIGADSWPQRKKVH
jgi:hypothetical protein